MTVMAEIVVANAATPDDGKPVVARTTNAITTVIATIALALDRDVALPIW